VSAIAPIAERQITRWAMSFQATERLVPHRMLARLPEDVHPYVAISREAGAGGGEIGRLVAERLGCECLDNQLLTHIRALRAARGPVQEREATSAWRLVSAPRARRPTARSTIGRRHASCWDDRDMGEHDDDLDVSPTAEPAERSDAGRIAAAITSGLEQIAAAVERGLHEVASAIASSGARRREPRGRR
jgi:hypothetical protein